MEYERLSGRSAAAAHPGRPNVVEFSGRRVIKDEVEAYLADLELTRRPARTVHSKRKYLGDFVGLIGKEFADEYRREDVLKYKNKLQDAGFAPKTIDTRMMAVVTFFNRWLKIKLGLDAKDSPETHDNDPEPYTDEEAAKVEAASVGEINLLIRTFRQTGCRDMELAHLSDTDLLDSKEIYIREKPCSDCKDCRSRGNVWRPKTPKGTRKIPVGDGLFAELKERNVSIGRSSTWHSWFGSPTRNLGIVAVLPGRAPAAFCQLRSAFSASCSRLGSTASASGTELLFLLVP